MYDLYPTFKLRAEIADYEIQTNMKVLYILYIRM